MALSFLMAISLVAGIVAIPQDIRWSPGPGGLDVHHEATVGFSPGWRRARAPAGERGGGGGRDGGGGGEKQAGAVQGGDWAAGAGPGGGKADPEGAGIGGGSGHGFLH